MSDRQIKNAIIVSVSIDTERVLSSWVTLSFPPGGQGFGGYVLSGPGLAIWVEGILKTLEVEKWEDLPNTACRIDSDWGKVYRIGHFLKDQWFDPVEAFKHLTGDAK